MRPFSISQNALARCIGVSPRCINQIVNGKRAITASTALGLGEALGPSAHFWMALQADYDIERERARQMGANARTRKPFPAPDAWVATFDGEVLDGKGARWAVDGEPLDGKGARWALDGETLDGEEVNSPYDERRHDWLGTPGATAATAMTRGAHITRDVMEREFLRGVEVCRYDAARYGPFEIGSFSHFSRLLWHHLRNPS